ncbi:hypothetical protein [Blastococcus sp. URHD0036]|uniref:hypothetical protein n=1 Tax=Blastococcus sp. URHD0036 TaxID=1380356 RepID=UPI00049785CE|nr:hypothetical protein [Blastococcus sp. URHD0036]
MWQNNLTVISTHCKNPAQQAWAIIQGFSGWLRIRPNSPDGVTNVFLLLTTALANNRKVDVLIVDNEITEATLR